MFVRVTGALKTFGNKRYINMTHLRVTSDPHELYFHILESIAVTLMAERGQVSPVCLLFATTPTELDSLLFIPLLHTCHHHTSLPSRINIPIYHSLSSLSSGSLRANRKAMRVYMWLS